MGQYMTFYVKTNANEMIPLKSFTGSSWGFHFGKEKVKLSNEKQPLSQKDISAILLAADDAFTITINSIKEHQELLVSYTEDGNKEDTLRILSILNEENQSKIEIASALGFYNTLESIISEAKIAGHRNLDDYIYATVVNVE